MTSTLILLGSGLDPLWRRYLDNTDSADQLIDLHKPFSFGQYPHQLNLPSWRRWLREHGITRLLLFHPDPKSLTLLSAAALEKIEMVAHLVQPLDYLPMVYRKILFSCTSTFVCPADFIAGHLRNLAVEQDRIRICPPEIHLKKVDPARANQLRGKFTAQINSPVLLALPSPENLPALYQVIWTAALVHHILKDLTLVVSCPADPAIRDNIMQFQTQMDADGMIAFSDDSTDWDELVAACDVVVQTEQSRPNLIRLWHVRQAGRTIVAARGVGLELLTDYDRAYLVPSPTPQHLAGALLPLLQTQEVANHS